jgi:hypothetical protein
MISILNFVFSVVFYVVSYPAWIRVRVSVSGGYGYNDTAFYRKTDTRIRFNIFFKKNKNNNKIGSYMQQGP